MVDDMRFMFRLFIFSCISVLMINAEIQYPEISFKYDWKSTVIDAVGRFAFGNSVTAERKAQLKKELPHFVRAWQQAAPKLFGEVFSAFKRGFKSSKRTASVYLCHNSSYGSDWFLILGLRYYLDPEPWLRPTSKEDTFVDLVFHELLHVWIDENISGKSALLKKYRHEHEYVRDHIHLMAIQKMVYLKLNRLDMVDHIDEGYRKLSLPEYRRAWEIVNDIEGYEAVIQDILNAIKSSY